MCVCVCVCVCVFRVDVCISACVRVVVIWFLCVTNEYAFTYSVAMFDMIVSHIRVCSYELAMYRVGKNKGGDSK